MSWTAASAGKRHRPMASNSGFRPTAHKGGTSQQDGTVQAGERTPARIHSRHLQTMCVHWRGSPLPLALFPPPLRTPRTASMPKSVCPPHGSWSASWWGSGRSYEWSERGAEQTSPPPQRPRASPPPPTARRAHTLLRPRIIVRNRGATASCVHFRRWCAVSERWP